MPPLTGSVQATVAARDRASDHQAQPHRHRRQLIGGISMLKTVIAATFALAAATPALAQVTPASLVGSYEATGTETSGKPYDGPGPLDISLAPSGALEFRWDNGKYVGVGQLVGNVLA